MRYAAMTPLMLCLALAAPSADPPTPAEAAQSLLNADLAFAAAAAETDMLGALGAMFADGVVMPAPPSGLAVGKTAVLEALAALPGVASAHASWKPLRVGVSADGEHGFTFGFLTMTTANGTRVPLKYMAYWSRESGAWRVVAYKRGRASGTPTDTTMMAPALPAVLVPPMRTVTGIAVLRRDLIRAEASFSAEAQRIGLGSAFAQFGTADAVNMGGAGAPNYVVGASAIAALVSGGDMTANPVHWNADTAFVASSGDLGITFGKIYANDAPAAGMPTRPASPFFTIWRRADASSPWRYVAE